MQNDTKIAIFFVTLWALYSSLIIAPVVAEVTLSSDPSVLCWGYSPDRDQYSIVWAYGGGISYLSQPDTAAAVALANYHEESIYDSYGEYRANERTFAGKTHNNRDLVSAGYSSPYHGSAPVIRDPHEVYSGDPYRYEDRSYRPIPYRDIHSRA